VSILVIPHQESTTENYTPQGAISQAHSCPPMRRKYLIFISLWLFSAEGDENKKGAFFSASFAILFADFFRYASA
jgi:hypothetical protein